MENLEEVLQALDEFQKMRPTEIPRELEDYLCWVAKTGDPVYQWSMIKTLFREKLTRVMTDFYESCPSLELAPCPNVEHFNYDTMKSSLLERLESFVNAPFTVQRICELLTAPRKEYNRVDKFMRAIEKNILVVSTREPGPITRRSENGDSMVNGSVDNDASSTQPPQDVEMEYWEKNCTSTVTISVHTMENETPLLHTVIPSATVVKSVFESDENQEKVNQSTSKPEVAMPSFIASTSEFSGVTNLTTQIQSQDSIVASNMQNLSTMVPETSQIVGDVPEAIMNEDTSSQPSLDLENEDNEATDATKRLQITFQAKDFTSSDSKASKFCLDNSKSNEKIETDTVVMDTEEETVHSVKDIDVEIKMTTDLKSTVSNNSLESVDTLAENFLKVNNNKAEDKINTEVVVQNTKENTQENVSDTESTKSSVLGDKNVQNLCSINNSDEMKITSTKSSDSEKDNLILSKECTDTSLVSDSSIVSKVLQREIESKEVITDSSNEMSLDVDSTKQIIGNRENLKEVAKPIIEESFSNDNNIMENSKNPHSGKDNLTIVEAIEHETRITKSIVPDPIPIIEEPKDSETSLRKVKNVSSVQITEETKDEILNPNCQTANEGKLISNESNDLVDVQDEETTFGKSRSMRSSIADSTVHKKECDTVELMDVDTDESLSIFQQDEPMEQETMELAIVAASMCSALMESC